MGQSAAGVHLARLFGQDKSIRNRVERRLAEFRNSEGFVEVRLLPGTARTIRWVAEAGFDPMQPLLPVQEYRLGLHAGVMSQNGIPRLLQLLSDANLHQGVGQLQDCRVDASAELRASRDTPVSQTHHMVEHTYETLGVRSGSELGFIWKDAAVAGQLNRLSSVLKDQPVAFLGARRILPFVDAMANGRKQFFPIPDQSAYPHVPLLVQQILRWHGSDRSQTLTVLHAAGTVGNTVSLEIASRGFRIKALDIGLAATIFDHEYLATRPWYRANSLALLRSGHALGVNQSRWAKNSSADEKELAIVEAGVSRLAAWPAIRRLEPDSPDEATFALRKLVQSIPDTVYAPIMEATLLFWEAFHFDRLDERLVEKIEAHQVKYEPWVLGAAAFAVFGRLSDAKSLLQRAIDSCPIDDRLPALYSAIGSVARGVSVKPLCRRLLAQPGRPDLGSLLTWSLDGDLPSARVR